MSTPSPALPYEVLDIVARFLIGDNAFQSCANLNTASHAVRDATLQTLWTHMYWTKFHDSKKYKREEVEAKWNIFKASQGSRYIRYMIEPYLPISPTDDRKRSVISCSINAHLKASISVDASDPGKQVQVHLFGEYGYSPADMGSVRQALSLLKRLPAFKRVTGIQVAVLATPANLPDASLGGFSCSSRPSVENGTETTGHTQPNDSIQSSSDDSDVDWLEHIGFSVDDFAQLDADNRIVVWHHVLEFVRPYARRRIRVGRDTTRYDRPEIWMQYLSSRDVLPNASAYAHVCNRDPISATFEVFLSATSEDEDDEPDYDAGNIQESSDLAHRVKDGYIRAAETVDAELLGIFTTRGLLEEWSAQVGVDPEDIKVIVQLGYDEAEFDLYPSGTPLRDGKQRRDA